MGNSVRYNQLVIKKNVMCNYDSSSVYVSYRLELNLSSHYSQCSNTFGREADHFLTSQLLQDLMEQ